MPVLLDVSIPIGATGAVGTITGPYISSVTRLAAGIYQIQLQDNYNSYYFGSAQAISPVKGSAIKVDASDAALSVGTAYQITVLGDATAADWTALGVPAGVTPAVGVAFVALATGAGTASVSRVKAIGDSGISRIELLANPNLSIAPESSVAYQGALGAIIMVQCLQAQIGSATTQGSALQYAPADPVSGSTLKISMMLSNSSVLIGGE